MLPLPMTECDAGVVQGVVPVPETAAAGPAQIAVAFGRVLRGVGLRAPVGAVVEYARALEVVGIDRRGPVYWAGRCLFTLRLEDTPLYDRCFEAFWLGAELAEPLVLVPPQQVVTDDDTGEGPGDEAPGDGAPDAEVLRLRYSPVEVLRDKDVAICTEHELREVYRLLRTIGVPAALRRSRRLVPASAHRGRLDVRTTVRLGMRTDGEVIRRAYRRPAVRHRRVVLLCDVSGSMAPYTSVLLRFAYVLVARRARAEVFALSTRLTRLTRQLGGTVTAIDAAAGAIPDLAGGTRLGEALRAFNDRHGMRGMARGSVVVVISDGWDRGHPEALASEMARLKRVAHRVIWVNPLKSSPGYEPLAQGMAAALPFIDDFMEGHSLGSLEALAEAIGA